MKNKRFINKINNEHIGKHQFSCCYKCRKIIIHRKHKKNILKKSSNDELIRLIEIFNQHRQGDGDSE